MAITLNQAGGEAASTVGISLTMIAVVNAGTERALIVHVSLYNGGTDPTVSSVTFNGDPLTQISNTRTADYYTSGEFGRSELWGMVNPDVVTGNVVITTNDAGNEIVAGWVAYNGVDQTTPFNNGTTAIGNSSTPSITVTSATGDLVLGAVVEFGQTIAVGAGQTERWEWEGGGAQTSIHGADEAGATSVTWSATLGLPTAVEWGLSACNIRQAGGGGGIACTEPVEFTPTSTNVTSYAFPAFTPAANAVLVVLVFATGTVAAGSMSGGSLTWTKATSIAYNSVDTAYVFWATTGASPGSTTITFDCTGDAATGCGMICFQFTNANLTTPIRQVKAGAATSANPNLTMDSALLTTNGYCAGFGINRNPPTSVGPTGWTETLDTGYTTPASGMVGAFRATGESGSTVTFTAATGNWGMVAVEVNAASQAVPGDEGGIWYVTVFR